MAPMPRASVRVLSTREAKMMPYDTVPLTDLTNALAASSGPTFIQDNLISDGSIPAQATDPNLVNPWGVSFSPTSPFWISDNGTGLATLYNGAGDIIPLVVAVPPPGSAPTGQVFNSSSSFNGDLFIFATEGGTITGWRGALGTT